MARLEFVIWAIAARFKQQHNKCPYCGSILHSRLQRKKFLIEARKCEYCDLIFRWPADNPEKAKAYYEESYQSGDVATDLPTAQEVRQFSDKGFGGTRYDKRGYIEQVNEFVAPPARILDFGASWGYVAYQLEQAGYMVEGFELSERRAQFGQTHLGLTIFSSWDELLNNSMAEYDLIFTAHTLEHLYGLKETLTKFGQVITAGGVLLIIVPNAGGSNARRLGVKWGPYIGEAHTIAFTAGWFRKNLPRHGFKVRQMFSPGPAGRDLQCDGDELVCVARKEETCVT